MGVVGVSRDLAGFGFLGQVARVVVLVEGRIDADTALDEPVVGIVSPSPLNPAVGDAVADRVQGEVLGLADGPVARAGGGLGQAGFAVVAIRAATISSGLDL